MRRFVTLILGLGLVVAACGTPAPDAADDPVDAAAASSEAATLADYLPMGPREEEDAAAYYQQQERDVQEQVRTCMAEQGFEYIPYVPNFEDEFYFEDLDEEAWAAQYGFGMAAWLLEEEGLERGEEWDPNDDPNYAITEAMSDSEQEAYFHALYGDEVDHSAFEGFDWETATDEELEEMNRLEFELWQDREWKGCMDLAWQEVEGGDQVWMSFEQTFGSMWEEVYAKVEADPRIVALEGRWESCMIEAGYDFDDMDAMYEGLNDEFESIVTWPGEEASTTGTTGAPAFEPVEQEDGSVIFIDEFGNEISEEQMEEMWRPQYDEAELRAFFQKEVDVAVANVRCTGDRWEIYQEVSEEYEAEWVAANKAALDAWKADLESEG